MMEINMIITVVVILAAMALFIWDYFPVDQVAIAAMVVLALTGVLTPEQAVQGFANPATITVAAMFILSDLLLKTGIIDAMAPYVTRLFRRGPVSAIFGMSVGVGGLSAFVNNTPVVATFIPVVASAARRVKMNPSKFLMPLSFAAIFGGTCTLIGTSTNLLVSGIAEKSGLEPFSMFLMAPMGLVFFVTGVVYMAFVGFRITADNRDEPDSRTQERIQNFLAEVHVIKVPEEGSLVVGDLISEEEESNVIIDRIKRGRKLFMKPRKSTALETGDVLLIRGNMKHIKRLMKNEFLEIAGSLEDTKFPREETMLMEIVILPNSELSYKKLRQVDFLEKYNANVLAIRQRGTKRFKGLRNVMLKSGDIILLQTNQQGYEMLQRTQNKYHSPFLSLRELGVRSPKTRELIITAATITAVITLSSLGLVSIMIAALAGIGLLAFVGIAKVDEMYRAIDWQVIFLLAGAISLGTAMSESGISALIADWLVLHVGENWGPIAVLSALYLTTTLLTEIMSNNASAALMAPIAISISVGMGLSPVPFLLAVAFAGSASFMTPIGYQTNTMVYSAGNFSFFDFTKVGLPLTVIFWLLATWLIPYFYPF